MCIQSIFSEGWHWLNGWPKLVTPQLAHEAALLGQIRARSDVRSQWDRQVAACCVRVKQSAMKGERVSTESSAMGHCKAMLGVA